MLIDTTIPTASNIPLEIESHVARGAYCNVTIVSHTQNEFVLDFAFVGPNQRSGLIVSRCILHPSQAMTLHRALTLNLDQYHASFGPGPDVVTSETGSPS